MMKLWTLVKAFFKSIVGGPKIPPEVANGDTTIAKWWEIYKANAPWLPYQYTTFDGVRRSRQRLTLNPAKMFCSEMAGLVLSEPPSVQAGAFVDAILEKELFWTNLRQALEYQGALGGQAIKPYKQGDEISLDFVKAQNFIPLTWDNSQITEAAFLDRRVKGDKAYVRVETHRRNEPGTGYVIKSEAFDEQTGKSVPLGDLWLDVEESVEVVSTEPLFVYIRNPEANNIDPESPLGISLFANAVDTFQLLDFAFDGLRTETVLGRQRVAMPATLMRGYLDPETGTRKLGFDPTDEAYLRVEGDDANSMKPTDLTGQFRPELFNLEIQALLDLAAVQIGFDAGYFSFDSAGIKTATEIISENSHTYKTIAAYRDSLDRGLKHLFRVLNYLGRLYKAPGTQDGEAVIVWDDGIIEDRNARADYHEKLVGAKLEDRVTAIMKVHGIDEAAATVMYEKINKENATINDASIFGGAGA